jgi:hypothetical protein
MSLAEPIAVLLEVTEALDAVGVRYVVGGSLASSVHGVPRSTADLDLLVELPGRVVDALVSTLSPRFHIDRDMILDAIRRRASFNILHLPTMFKVDLFVSDRSPILSEEMARRQQIELGDPPRGVYVCSPEDIVVQKLAWYDKGGGVSDRQWGDVMGVLQVRGATLDLAYMRRLAHELGLTELYDRALREAGLTI